MKPPHLCPTRYCRRHKAKKKVQCSRCAMRAWRAANPVKALLAHLRDHAAEKGVLFDLTFEWFELFLRKSHYDRKIHHIDRAKTWLGYVKGNIQVLVCAENIAKGNRERHVQQKIARHRAMADCPF